MRSDSKNRITVSSTTRAPSSDALENARDLASPCASKENRCFKENITISKSGASNLCLEPQQMKKKKKGGKNNLRKSLAWDRAFFTEEGVLDPLELSVISGVSCRGELPFVSEDNAVSSNRYDDFHKDKRNDLSSPKFDLSSSNRMTSASLASCRVPTPASSKSGSRYSDCPRPLPSPSIRGTNANVGKATSKDINLPKVPGLKLGLSPTCATTRSTINRGSHMKRNQITQPDFSIQRDAELRGPCKSQRNTENTSRANNPQSACCSDGKLGCSSVNRHLTFGTSPMTVGKGDNLASKTIPVTVTQIRLDNLCGSRQYDSATFTTSCSQNAQFSGRMLHPSQNQTMKPSGLRMPSPSLSFFSQPKPSVFRNLPLRDRDRDRDTDSYFFGSRNPGCLRSQDKSSSTTKSCDKIPDSRTSSSNSIPSSSESAALSHVGVRNMIKPNMEQDPMYEVRLKVKSDVLNSHPIHDKIFEDYNNVFGEIQGSHKKNIMVRVSEEEPELQKIGTEVPSQNGSCGEAMDSFIDSMDDCLVKIESCGSYQSQSAYQSDASSESQRLNAIDGRHEINNKCKLLAFDHPSTQRTYGSTNSGVQNTLEVHCDWRKSSKRDCHEAQLEETDPLKHSLRENDQRTEKDIRNETERASGQLDVSQQNGIYSSESMKALGQEEAMAERPYFVSMKLNAVEVSSDNLPAAGSHEQIFVSASTVEGSKNDNKIVSEVSNDNNHPSESPDVQDFHDLEMESKEIGKLNIKSSLSAEKQVSLQSSKQENTIYELPPVVSDRKDQEKVIDPTMPSLLSLGKRHKSSLGKERAVASPLRTVECDSVNSFSSESCNSPINTIFDCDAGSSYGNFSPVTESKMRQLSPEDILRTREEVPHNVHVTSADNESTSTMSLKNSDSEIHNLKDIKDTQTLLVQSSERNMSSNICVQQSECLSFDDEFGVDNLLRIDDCVQAKHLPDVCSNVVGGMNDSVKCQHEILQSISQSSTPAKESPFKHETCNDEYETGSGMADAIADSSRVELFSDSSEVEVSQDTDSFLSCVPPKLDLDKVETELLPNNTHGDRIEEKKSLLLVIPPNAVPFSDEWLAAMEAAGEDVLTRKSGKVQNSPPDKPLPEPSPWSPVKRKNNQITPFDCTKFTAPSDS